MLLTKILILVGQGLLALYFVIGAVSDVVMRHQAFEMMLAKKIPFRRILFFAAVALKFFAGLGVLVNFMPSIFAIALAIFTLIANIIFNDFWDEEGIKRQFTLARFLANTAVIGGLILIIAIHGF